MPSRPSLRAATIRLAYWREPALRSVLLPMVRVAIDFETQDAYDAYLKDHPDADKSKHKVVKVKEDAPKEEEESSGKEPSGKEPFSEKKFEGFLSKVKGLGKAAIESLQKAPEHVKAFVSDPEERKAVLSKASDALKKAPAVVGKRVLDAAKAVGEDFTTTGGALKKLKNGEALNDKDKKAMRSVALTMATVAIAGATGGTAMAAGAFGKAIVQSIAANAVSSSLGSLMDVGDVGEVASGLFDLLKMGSEKKDKEKDPDFMVGFTNLVVTEVAKSLEKGMPDEDMHKVLKSEATREASTRVASRWLSLVTKSETPTNVPEVTPQAVETVITRKLEAPSKEVPPEEHAQLEEIRALLGVR